MTISLQKDEPLADDLKSKAQLGKPLEGDQGKETKKLYFRVQVKSQR